MINWKRIRCKLTGGHMYKTGTVDCQIDDNGMVTITDVCYKCGKRYSFTVPYSTFFDLPQEQFNDIKEVLEQDNVDKTCDNCKYHTDAEEIHGKTPCGTCGHEHINFVERVKL